MSIDRGVVEHVARLAYIDLSDAEVDEMARQLSSVVGHRLAAPDGGDRRGRAERPRCADARRHARRRSSILAGLGCTRERAHQRRRPVRSPAALD